MINSTSKQFLDNRSPTVVRHMCASRDRQVHCGYDLSFVCLQLVTSMTLNFSSTGWRQIAIKTKKPDSALFRESFSSIYTSISTFSFQLNGLRSVWVVNVRKPGSHHCCKLKDFSQVNCYYWHHMFSFIVFCVTNHCLSRTRLNSLLCSELNSISTAPPLQWGDQNVNNVIHRHNQSV